MRIKTTFKLLAFLLCFKMFAQPSHSKIVVGYYAQWAIYSRDYNIPNIDGDKLTHLYYAFFDVDYDSANPENTKLLSIDQYADFEHTETGAPWNAPIKGNFYDLQNLKAAYPHLKIVVSIGGWTRSQKLPYVAEDPIAREALAADMAQFLVTYPFIDGFDIDWEYPIVGGTDGTEYLNQSLVQAQPHTANDHVNLVRLLESMRNEMPNKIITIAAGNNVNNVVDQYIGPNNRPSGMTDDLTTYCDFITFFGYDFGGNWFDKTCYNAPLYPSGNSNDPLHDSIKPQALNVLVNQFLNDVGIPNNKLVMGLPFYGKIFDNVENDGTIPSLPGLYVNAPRVASWCNPQPPKGTWDVYNCEYSGSVEFCDLSGNVGATPHHYLEPGTNVVNATAAAAGWVRYWDDTCKVPYLYNSTTKQFVSYDDTESIDEKCKFIIQNNLAGGMIWELSQDTRENNSAVLLTQVNTSFTQETLASSVYSSNENTYLVYFANESLNIKVSKQLKSIDVYNTMGLLVEKIDASKYVKDQLHSFNVNLKNNQLYIVNLNFEDGSLSNFKLVK